MIHMIFELFVSSALICAYTSETPGACAPTAIAPRNTTPAAHAHTLLPRTFSTFPPRSRSHTFSPRSCSTTHSRIFPEFYFPYWAGHQYTLARSFAQFALIADLSCHALFVAVGVRCCNAVVPWR